ncbi:hypothetical protein IX317_002151 [Fusobacterium sp. DD29]|uniref:phage tail protein n=1 Tax=unclassified Fusobacterium TaxID=2648384 RepID=UPI001B8BA089|nr:MULTISPECIES: phage tail protein [unclassified Fusobacterium]MBR8701166.1 hypothetical protein [Fusobacterium sp. DD45]MBR8711321.1 hypothetical protein [Fusobacterium sp. DD28]MBR8750429.1 hypothetical protein [Fusobacterium sp. DD29]MBR8751870.1 hypothetical protein [Fusobacterium sp. DD26]MBR8762669.1 hypothetical protein [Fusobacterium sp. DD25]
MVVGSLGKTIFACSSFFVRTFNNLTKSSNYRWIEHKVIGEKPKLQFDGVDLENIKFNIILSAAYNLNPALEAHKLKEKAADGEKFKLIIGGEVLGDYVIASINETHKQFTAFGNVTRVDLSVELKEYN